MPNGNTAKRISRQRESRSLRQYPDLRSEPTDPLRRVPVGHGLSPAPPPLPHGAALPLARAARPPVADARIAWLIRPALTEKTPACARSARSEGDVPAERGVEARLE